MNADSWNNIADDIFKYEAASSNELNHAVVLIGYKEAEGSTPAHWIIKNSWGTYWGSNGFGKLEYGPDGNIFGVCLETSYPIV